MLQGEGLFPQISPDIASLQVSDLTNDEFNALAGALVQYYENVDYRFSPDVTPNIAVMEKIGVPGIATSLKAIPAEPISTPTGQDGGKDVAILKIEGNNLPTVPLGDENTLGPLSNIIAIGFPGIVSEAFTTDMTPSVEPSVTEGQFSGFQDTALGFKVIQTSTPIQGGNSGGPAVNASGYVVGITTFTLVDPATGERAPGFTYLEPVSIVKDFLRRINVQPQESEFTRLYRQAWTEYSQQHFKDALDTMVQLSRISPANPYVQSFMSTLQQKVSGSQNQTITTTSPAQNSSTATR
jgi:hypothetical protein